MHLYAKELNVYGDTGNTLILQKRLSWRGVESEILQVGIGEDIPDDTNLIVSGGGQDSSQIKVAKDIKLKAGKLLALAKRGVPMLLICGSYQLFGLKFVTSEGKELEGIGILDIETIGSEDRLIGNIEIDSAYGQLYGFENHSGRTFIKSESTKPFGKVVSGSGNNGGDNQEGAIKFNIFGSYLHGPILSRNPLFADQLLQFALNDALIINNLKRLDDQLEIAARSLNSRNIICLKSIALKLIAGWDSISTDGK